MNNWTEVIKTTVPQYPLKGYGAVSVLYNSADEQELIVAGYASPQVVDREKHLITKKALSEDLERFLAHPHYRNAMLLHSNVQVGEVLPRWCNEAGECWETKVDEVGLFAVVKIRTDPHRPSIVDKVIQDIREGKIASFSISADAPFESRRYECVDGACFWIIDAIEYYEITLCETPVNQDANFTILTKSMEDEFKASAFCQDGSCPISTFDPIAKSDRRAYMLRKAPLGGAGGNRGNGVADPVEAIPAAKPKQAIDPRKPQQADTGAKAGGNAGAGRDAIAKDFPVETDDLSYALGSDGEGEEYYLNKTGLYAFTELESLLERAIDEVNLGLAGVQARMTLAALQKGDILKGFSYLQKTWVVWTDTFPSALNKEFLPISDVLDSIADKALKSGNTPLWNDALFVKSNLQKRSPLRGTQATYEYADMVTRMILLSKPLDTCGLVVNREAIKGLTNKGYEIGWVGNAQRSLNNAVEALRTHVINNEETRITLSPDILAALDVLYEDMQSVADNLGIGRALEKFKLMGDRPELEIISEVANSTLKDVRQADILLEKVDNSEKDELGDPAQVFKPENFQVQTGVTKAGDHSDSAMIAWFLPPDLAGKLAIAGGEAPEELHLTLAYFPDITQLDSKALVAEIAKFASQSGPLQGKLSGVGRFSGKKDVCYISADIPELPTFRQTLLAGLTSVADQTHGFTPHVTLKYLEEDEPNPVNRLPEIPIVLDSITLMFGDKRRDFGLGGDIDVNKAIQNKAPGSPVIQMTDFWEPKKPSGFHNSPMTGDHDLDTISSGTHNPVEVVRKTVDEPTHVLETPANVKTTSPERPEFDTRGALRAGDEDAKQLALGLGRIFHRTVNDARYKLAIVKDDNGQQRIIDLGY